MRVVVAAMSAESGIAEVNPASLAHNRGSGRGPSARFASRRGCARREIADRLTRACGMIDDLDASRKQFERLPVDRSDRLERRERDTRESSEQRAIRQRRMFERQGGNEKRPIAIFVDNADREPPIRERDPEAIENIHVDEGRDMHLLDGAEATIRPSI
ncbi:MAG TPA: hypothetical protein PLB34_19455, partial [Rhodoblastus sp.]|nr:hypothetical protein [Rhodoblastus sp.]